MVLTTVPTTALTVHAETDGDNTEIVAETEIDPSGLDENQDENVPDDSNSELSDEEKAAAAEAEAAKKAEEEAAKKAAEEEAAKKAAEEEAAKKAAEAADGEVEPADPSAEEAADPEKSVAEAEQTTMSNETYAAIVSESAVVTEDIQNKDEADTTTATENAQIFYMGGCVSDKKVVENRDLVFRVEPKDGRVLDKVSYKIGDGESAATVDKTSEAKSGNVTILKGDIFTTADGVTTGKPVTITVVTKPVVYTVALDNSGDSTNSGKYDLYAVTGTGDSSKLAAEAYDAAKKPTVEYGKSLQFALVPKADQAVKPSSIQLNSKDITFEKKELEQEAAAPAGRADAETKTAYVFTVDTSKAEYGLAQHADEEATVTVAARALNQLTVTMIAADNSEYEYAASAENTAAANYINYDATLESGNPKGFAKIDEESADLEKSLAFMVKPTAGNLITGVTAKVAGTTGDPKDVTVVTADVTGSNNKECTIDLSQSNLDLAAGALTLTVKVETGLDKTTDGVTEITFAGAETGDLAHVEYKAADESAGLEAAESGKNNILVKGATSDDYYIQVSPKTGYELAKSDENTVGADGDKIGKDKQIVTIKETRKVDGETDPVPVSYAAEAYVAAVGENEAEVKPIQLTLKAAAAGEEKAYTVTAVEVTIGTAPAENTDEKKVTFSGDLLDSVTIKNTAGVVLIEEDEATPSRTYAIAEGVNLFQFDVASDAEPAVQLNDADLTGTAAEGGNSFSYSVPTAALKDDANGITVNEGDVDTKTVTVKVVNENLSADVEDGCQYMIGDEAAVLAASENENEYKLVGKTSSSSPAVGSAVSMKLVAATGVVFGDVTYTVKGGEAQAATVSADKRTATVEFTVTDNVEVTVETKTELRVVLSGTGVDPVEDTEGAYTANYDVTGITAKLIEGVNTEANIYDVVVLDGTTTAATTATVSGKAAAISKIEEADRGTTLTIRVYKTSREYADATLAVSGTSTGVSVKMDGKEVPEAGVTMPSDSEAVLEVSAEGTAANTKDLKAAIVFEKNGDAAVTGKATDFFGDVDANGTIAINEGKIVLKAKPAKAAPTDKVSLVISSTTVKDDTDQTKDKEFKKIPLNVTGPLVTSDEIKEVKAAAASSSNREVRLNLDLEFKDMKKLPKAPLAGDLYYKVEFTKVEGDAEIQTAVTAKTLELKTKEELTRLVKIEKSNGSYNKADLAKFVEFNLVKSFKDAEGNVVTGDLPGIITAEAKVTLVQSLGTSLTPASTADDYVAVVDDKVKTVTEGLTTSAPIYETKLTVKLVNGAAVFTGQSKVTVATPSFSKDTTCDEITVQFVDTKTGLLRNANSVGSKKTNASYSGFTAGVNEDNSIWVSSAFGSTNAKDYKDLGVKVTAHAENDEYRASAVVKLKVQQGIYSIETDESKAALPETLYSDNKGAVKSVKIATTLNSGDRDTKPAKSNLTWEITDGSGKSINDAGCALPANIKKALTAVGKNGKPAPTITVKNGTVSVAKGYEYDTKNPGGNTFYVNAKAADFAGNTTTLNSGYPVCFTISKDPQVIEKLAVVGSDDAPVGEVSSDRNGVVVTLTAEEVIEDNLRVVALKNGAELVYGCYDSSDFLPATINISGKLVTLDKDGNASQPHLVFSKPGDKITVTAKVVDGSKAKDVKMTLNVKPFEQLGLRLHATNDAEYAPDTKDAISYSGSSNERYDLSLMYYSKEYEDWQDLSSYKNVKVKVDNGKFVANKEWAKDEEDGQVGSAVVVASGKDTATITLTDTGAKNAVKNTYTITTDVNTGNMKAPNIKMTAPKKLTAGYWGAIKWNVSDQDKQTKKYIYAGQYVKLAPDFTVAPLTDSDKKYLAGERDAYEMLDRDGEYYRIDENGEFETWFSSSGYANSHYLRPGTYKMVATIGTIDNGKFTPTTKDKKLSFSVPKWKTASTSLSVTGGYKLDVKSAAEAKILVKTGTSYKVFDAKNVIKKDQKLGDHSNNFTTYFEVKRNVWKDGSWVYSNENENEWIGNDRTYDGQSEYATIGLKPNLTVDQVNYITDKAGKDDCTGYITVDNGYFRKDIKITIGFSELKKYTAKADPFFANSAKYAVNVKIYNGKTYVPVKYAAIDTGEKSKNDITPAELKVSVADGDILLERANGFEANKYTISLKVVPESVALIKENDAAVSALDEAKMLESYAIPAELKLEVKDLAKADKTLNTNLAVKLATYEYDEYRNGGYEFGVSGKYGKYRADVPYSLTADNMTVKDAVVTWENNAVAESLNLVEAAKGTTKVWNSSTDEYDTVQSINLKVNKEALEKALDKNNKPLYYGKTLTVPVEITYENSAKATAKETVNYKITVPKKPADTFDEAAVNSKLENLYVNIDDETPANTIDHLSGKIYDAVALLVPADTDYKITELKAVGKVGETEVTAPVDVVKTGKAAFSFKIMNNVKTTEAAKTFNFTYDLGIKPSEVGDEEVTLAGLKTEVSTKLDDGTVTYAKDKTAEAVMTDLTKADGSLVKKVLDDAQAGRKNYTIKAKVEHIAATKTTKASMKVTVEIRNLTNREEVDDDEWLRLVTVTKTIVDEAGAELSDFDAAYTAVSDFFKESTNITGIVDDCSGQADDIWKAIETKAKELVNNPGITVTVENQNYVPPKADNAETGDVDESANGTISFTIKLVENGRVRNYKVAEIQIPKAKATQYAPIATVETDITKAIITDDNTKPNEKLKGIANPEGKDAINDSDALKAAIETEIKKIVAAKPAESGISVVEDPAAKYSGYLYEIQEWAFSPASKKAVATLSFKLVITLKGNSSSTRTIPVSCDDLIGTKEEYQTLKELAAEFADVTEFTVAAAPTADNYKATLKTKLGELDNANVKRTIELTEEGTFTAATDTPKADAKVEGVKITVTEGEKTENVEMKTITFKVAAAQD